MKPLKIGLFGGTFDPVHTGHLSIAENAQKTLALDKIYFIPCRQSPLKESGTLASAEQRLEMLSLATQDLDWAEVEDWELVQTEPNYSWKTVNYFEKRFPDADFFWLMGEDQWDTIDSWNRSDYFRSLVKIVVHGRGAFLPATEITEEVRHLKGSHEASATKIRENFKSDVEPPPGWLSPAVLEFIQKNRLYRDE